MKIQVFNEQGLYIIHIKEINNSIVINEDIYGRLKNKEGIEDDAFIEYRKYNTLVNGQADTWYYGIRKNQTKHRQC